MTSEHIRLSGPLKKPSIGFYFLLMLSAYFLAAAGGLGLVWDGAYCLFESLQHGQAWVGYHREINLVLQQPTIFASLFTSDTTLLTAIFTLSYLAVPFFSLLISWWVVRTSAPHLFIWAALGIGLLSLPGQAFVVSEGISVIQLAWPILLILLAGQTRRYWYLAVSLGFIMALTHLFAVPLLLAFAFLAALLYRFPRLGLRPALSWVGIFLGLALLAGVRSFFGEFDSTHTAEISSLGWEFNAGVGGAPLAMLALAYTGAFAWVLGRSFHRAGLELTALGFWILAGLILIPWASNAATWWRTDDYRYFTIFMITPLMGFALLDAVLTKLRLPSAEPGNIWAGVILSQGLIVLLVLASLSFSFQGLEQQVKTTLADNPNQPCITIAGHPWSRQTALGNWTAGPASLLLQGREPAQVILANCRVDYSRGLPLTAWEIDRYNRGWFDLSLLGNRLTAPPGVVTHFAVTVVNPYEAGMPHSVTVTALDAGGYYATGYLGTVSLSSSDPHAALPGNHTFSVADAGVYKFTTGLILKTAGPQTVTATDLASPAITGSTTVTVTPASK